MFRATDVAYRGLRTHQTFLDVTGNNIANVNSDGFKKARAMFEDTLSQVARGSGMPMPQPAAAINPAMLGLGSELRGVRGSFDAGVFKITNQVTDLAVQGEGYFVLQSAQGPVYTRNGGFSFDSQGVLRAGDGKAVLGLDDRPIRVPDAVTAPPALNINAQGQVVMSTGSAPVVLGTVKLARFANQAGLERVGNTEFRATPASGAPITGPGQANGLGDVVSGVVENSNVDLGSEFSNLILAQRGFQANSRVMTATDELINGLNKMRP